jgi:hypothetical protein
MNSLNCLMRPISLESQGLWKEDNEDKNEPQRKTKNMRLKQTKSKRLPEQGRQRTRVRSPTPRRADRGSPGTRTRTKPKPEPPNQRLGTTILDNHRNTIGRGIKIQIESRNTISRIRTIWTEGSGQPRTRNGKHTEYRTNYNHHWSHNPHHLALNPYTRRRPAPR